MKKLLVAIALVCLCFFFGESNLVVLITGASRGIGLVTAELLAKNGFTVYN